MGFSSIGSFNINKPDHLASAQQTQCWMLSRIHVSRLHYSMQRAECRITAVEALRLPRNDTKTSAHQATEKLFELSKAAMMLSTGQNPKAISGSSHIQWGQLHRQH